MRLSVRFHAIGTAYDIIVINNLCAIHIPLEISVLNVLHRYM